MFQRAEMAHINKSQYSYAYIKPLIRKELI